MIDFVKIQANTLDVNQLLMNPYLEFMVSYNEKTSELSIKKRIAEYKKLKFIITDEKYIEIQGSLHKYKNNGEHNYDRFTFDELQDVLSDLYEKFGLDLNNSIIQNIETAVNIIPPVEVKKILMYLMFHKGQLFKDVFVRNGNYRQAAHQRYYVKCYDKGLQNKLPYQLFRFELKFIKMYDLKEIGIITLSDLKDRDKLNKLKGLLVLEWSKTFLYDHSIDKTHLTKYVREVKLNQWSNPNYWVGLKKAAKIKQLAQYQKIINRYSNGVHKKVLELIINEFDQLLIRKR